jgi:hypothetical protein
MELVCGKSVEDVLTRTNKPPEASTPTGNARSSPLLSR